MLQLRIAQSFSFLSHAITPHHISKFKGDRPITKALSSNPVHPDLPDLTFSPLIAFTQLWQFLQEDQE